MPQLNTYLYIQFPGLNIIEVNKSFMLNEKNYQFHNIIMDLGEKSPVFCILHHLHDTVQFPAWHLLNPYLGPLSVHLTRKFYSLLNIPPQILTAMGSRSPPGIFGHNFISDSSTLWMVLYHSNKPTLKTELTYFFISVSVRRILIPLLGW